MQQTNNKNWLYSFIPQFFLTLKQGYSWNLLRADLSAALAVAIIAIPLSMAIAIGCGAHPATGIFSVIIGGLIVSCFGGSRFQIGGPATAFIVLMSHTIALHGFDGFLTAVMMSGVMLTICGFLRLGDYVYCIPYPVIVGFTSAVAVLTIGLQTNDFLGMPISHLSSSMLNRVMYSFSSVSQWNFYSLSLGILSLVTIKTFKKINPSLPGLFITVVMGAALVAVFQLPIETILSKFGAIPDPIPSFSMLDLSFNKMYAVLPQAIAMTLLGGIESLLSAMIADNMTGHKHNSNCELVAQGVANIISPLFGGLNIAGTMARTVTNVQSGARTPVAGVAHSIFVFFILYTCAPLVSYIPIPTLAAILISVGLNMFEKKSFMRLLKARDNDTLILLVTFLTVSFYNLTDGMIAGIVLNAFLHIKKKTSNTSVEFEEKFAPKIQKNLYICAIS